MILSLFHSHLPPFTRCAVIAFAQGQHEYNFECEIMEARFIRVVLPGEGKTLTLCEVQVFGAVLGELQSF